MFSSDIKQSLVDRVRSMALWTKILVLASVGALPAIASTLDTVYAAPTLQNREARVTTTQTGATFDITFEFDTTAVSSDVERIEIEFADSPLGSYAGLPANIPTVPAASTISQNGWDGGAFGTYTRTNGDSYTGGGSPNNQIVVSRTDATDEGNNTDLQIGFTGLTNNAAANTSYYPRIRLYDDASAGTLVWEGVVAQSTAEQLTVNARVQERLDFCVGATDIDDATTNSSGGAATADSCSNVTSNGLGTTIDLGVIDTNFTNVSPVASTNGGNEYNGIAMIRTNAFNGAVIDYFAEQESGSGRLKVAGASCTSDGTGFDTGSSNTDQCFDAAGTTASTIAAGTEEFGMTVAGVNCGSTAGYTCDFSLGSYNLVRDTEYDGNGGNTFVADADQVPATTSASYAWDQSGTTDRIASSTGSAVKVIDDEALILKFAATASVTTPTGQYTVTSTYIATATF